MSAPLYERLTDYHKKNRISFAMPGHKNGRGLRADLLACDVTELDATENLHRPREFVTESKRLLSKLYGSDTSYILTCGSTAAIQAMIASCVKRGGMLLAASDCHMSVINACAVLGINLKFIPREIDRDFLVADRLLSVKKYIDGADAVIITSPTYYGMVSDIEQIAEECHSRGIPLLADEAHGAHFIADECFPTGAIGLGADAVCQSAHKTLNALTGAAYLHVGGNLINKNRLEKALTSFQTSSPSYIIAASADLAREELERGGWGGIIDECRRFKEATSSALNIKCLENDDPTRIVLNFCEYETTGFEISERLSEEFGIDVEMADLLNIVLIVTSSNTSKDLRSLHRALKELTKRLEKRKTAVTIAPPPAIDGVISPSAAFFADTDTVAVENSAGMVSAVTVNAYPPGIPVICTGAKITQEQIEYIKYMQSAGAEIAGVNNGKIETVKSGESV